MFFIFLLNIILSLTFTFGKAALAYCSPIFFTAVRMCLAGFLLVTYFWIRYPTKFKELMSLKYARLWLVLAIFNIYLTNVLDFWGLKTLSAAKTSFLYSLSPFFAAFFSYIIFGERMTAKKWIGMFLGFFGFLPVLFHSTPTEELMGGISIFSWAELAVLGSAASWALGMIIMRHSIHRKAYPPVLANGMSMIIGGLAIFPTSYFVEVWNPVPISNVEMFGMYLVVITVISNLINYNLYGWLLKKYTVTFLSFTGFMMPLFSAIFGWLFLGETVGWHFFASIVLVFCGLIVFYQEELRLGYLSNTAAQ